MIDSQYDKTLEWLFSQLPMFSRIGAPAYKPGLDTTHRLDKIYGHLHRRFKAIHVGGTNGKGSTSHMLAAVLQSEGYKTGLYTSPHLTDFRERMRINGEMIPKENVVKFINEWKQYRAEQEETLRPSFFELTMMMAFDWFAKEKVDYAVIEVGMGGRLDSTNVITPILSIITNISFDHTQFLGTTLTAIAKEKAGIIKEGIAAVVGEATNDVKEVFLTKAMDEDAPIVFADQETLHTEGIKIPLRGTYQKKNVRTVFCALEALRKIGVTISDNAIKTGLENVDSLTGLRGRWQKIGSKPDVICDTGHNEAGIAENMVTLREAYPNSRIHFVIGFVNDKDVARIIKLFPKDGIYYFTQAGIPRAMPVGEVARHFATADITGTVYPEVNEAFEAARNAAGSADAIYVGGSTFVVADLLKRGCTE